MTMQNDESSALRGRGILHALGLHMHQPPGNLRLLIDSNEWEAQQIIRCYERVPRYARELRDVARIHVGFSGILLEQFRSPEIIDRYRQFVDIPAMLDSYKHAENIELIGMGYYHPIFPLIPREDWDDHLVSGRQIMADVFGREPRGFWPPEMAFNMEMVPALAEAGYDYVVVDGVHVQPEDKTDPPNLNRPYTARNGGKEITVVPRDRDLSNAQESGLDADWFLNAVSNKITAPLDNAAPPLVTTWSDGENGGWFRQMAEEAGFFGHFFTPFIEQVRSGNSAVSPILLSDYLEHYPPRADAHVQTGAWNVADTSGYDFSQWAGSDVQREAIAKIFDVSRRYWALARGGVPDNGQDTLERIRQIVLESETSCFLFWGDAWVPQLYERTTLAEQLLSSLENATY
jgi:alpha-amylase/alpha-mannosidase (GH57 family)